ncbi:hypothetical protein Ferpe_1821 [Fervidobacterium pennivorans DSM 9078]|jgi:hypothetical protein|uniref:Uncharacterized protein n=1 Tax=Fervidobacterium pennivorans (strain DSM 9078 / Ven5) TaxID=771875 RepID=H9UEC9_FERPD|nr:hypothetical protein Ferpe_1821 [Fervidobacterium pennivorans DSM 9078]
MSTPALVFMLASWGFIILLSAASIGTILKNSKKAK